MMKRIIGLYLIVAAVVVAVQTVVEPLYHTSSEAQMYSPFWDIVNPLCVLAIVLGVIFGYIRKRNVDNEDTGGAVTREFFAANTLFYGFLFVSILFFWNWFNLLSPAFTAIGEETVSLVWKLVDVSLPLLAGAMGMHLLQGR